MFAKVLCILCLLLMPVLNVCAQGNNDTINPSHSALGVFAGANGTMALNIAKGYTPPLFVSFSYGIYGAFDIGKRWRTEASISYISYGCKYLRIRSHYGQNDTGYVDGNYSTFAGYASGMLLMKYRMNDKSGLIIGARLSKMVSSSSFLYSGYVSRGNLVMTNIEDDGNRLIIISHLFDLGLVAGYEYSIRKNLRVSAFFNAGLLPILRKEQIDNTIVANNYNRSLQLRVSYDLFQ
jgi:hypothetical protein